MDPVPILDPTPWHCADGGKVTADVGGAQVAGGRRVRLLTGWVTRESAC